MKIKDIEKELDKALEERLKIDTCRAQITNFVQYGSFTDVEDFLNKLEEEIEAIKSSLQSRNSEISCSDL